MNQHVVMRGNRCSSVSMETSLRAGRQEQLCFFSS